MKIIPHENESAPTDADASASGFTLIQVAAVVILIATLASMIMGSVKTTADRASAASKSRSMSLQPLLQDASGIVSNQNAIARQADQVLNTIK